MKKHALAIVLVCFCCSTALARHYFASITSVDAEKGVVTFKYGYKGKDKTDDGKPVLLSASITKDCVIREGYVVLGKPAHAKEGDPLANGLKNFVFKNATAEVPLKADIFVADTDDKDKGIKKGDIIKILVKQQQ